jgi:hypothetical protein
MHSALTKEEIMQWRRSTEKITLEEFAQRLGKLVQEKKETNDLHDILLKKQENPQVEEEHITIKKEIREEARAAINEIAKKAVEQGEKLAEKSPRPDFEFKVSFKKKLNKREEAVFNYFCNNRKQKVSVNDLANLLELPNDYVYKYIKNLRSKLGGNVLVNTDSGGYMLNA